MRGSKNEISLLDVTLNTSTYKKKKHLLVKLKGNSHFLTANR